MKKISINLLTNVLLLLAGLLFILLRDTEDIIKWVACIMGVTFAVPSLIFLIVGSLRKETGGRNVVMLGVLPAVGGLLFGVVLMVKSEVFVGMLSFMLGMLLCTLGVYHIIYLLLSLKKMPVKLWHFVCPLLVLCGGGYILYNDCTQSVVSLITGVSFVLFNVTSLQEYVMMRKAVLPQAGQDDGQASEGDGLSPESTGDDMA